MLATVPFDTHAAVKTLTAAGASEEVAVAVVDVAQEAAAEHGRNLATRADIAGLRTELRAEIAELRTELRAEIGELRTELRAEIGEMRAELRAEIGEMRAGIDAWREATRADIAELHTEQARMETRLIKWVVGTALVVGALIVGILRLT